jgi:phenylalanyl-tRNA synthetase beta chain
MIVSLLNKLGVKDLQFIAESEYGVYHPGRCARIVARHIVELENGPAVEEVELGIMGEVHPEVADKYGIGTRCYAAELMFNTVTELSDLEKVFSPLPKYPATSRDIALLVDEDMLVGDIENVIRAAGTEILRDVKLFDIYRGKQVEEGKKSVAFNLTYRHNDRTLTDEDVNAAHGQVLQALRDNLDAVLREM